MEDRKPLRAENGQLLPGQTANPLGTNGHLVGWQRYGDRLQKWLALPGDEIAELVGNTAKRNKLSSIDIACVRQAAVIIGGEEWLDALEKGLDRIEGKPKQPFAHGGDKDNPIPINLDVSTLLKELSEKISKE